MKLSKFFSLLCASILSATCSCTAMKPKPKEVNITDVEHLQLFFKEPNCGQQFLTDTIHTLSDNYENVSIAINKPVQKTDLTGLNSKIDCFVACPDFKDTLETAERSIQKLNNGGRSIIYSRINFISSEKRSDFFKMYPPKYIYVYNQRPKYGSMRKTQIVPYAWYIWEKNDDGSIFKGDTEIQWINMFKPNLEYKSSISKQPEPEHYLDSPKLDQSKIDPLPPKPLKESIFNKRHVKKCNLKKRAENDFYCTKKDSVTSFLNKLKEDNIVLPYTIREPSCGKGDISNVLKEYGYNVISSDLIDRGYGDYYKDFLEDSTNADCFLTNPPFILASDFILHSIECLNPGGKSIMYLKLNFLSGTERSKLFSLYPPKYVYLHTKPQICYKAGDTSPEGITKNHYAWYIWERNTDGSMFSGNPILRWID